MQKEDDPNLLSRCFHDLFLVEFHEHKMDRIFVAATAFSPNPYPDVLVGFLYSATS